MSAKYYTGIGSRSTPEDVLKSMTEIARALNADGWVLRSGGAEGADSYFEKGAGTNKNIFLPWKGFNGSLSKLYEIPEEAFKVAEKMHPSWSNVSYAAKKLHARNIQQVTGPNLKIKSKFVVCWTPGGKCQGGTATAIKLAETLEIKVFNLYTASVTEVLDYAKRF